MGEMLLELFSEEIPARMQLEAADRLKNLFIKELHQTSLSFGSVKTFFTPRRLVLVVNDLAEYTESVITERKGPKVDAPQSSIQGFLRSTGKKLNDLEKRSEKKGEFFYVKTQTESFEASATVSIIVEKIIRNFPWRKSMRWGNGDLRWVRPLRSILCIISSKHQFKIVPVKLNQLVSSNKTYGHSRMSPYEFTVNSFDDYRSSLKKAKVILEFQDRIDMITKQILKLTSKTNLTLVKDETLLAEVAGLVEWPVALLGLIKRDYLSLPNDILQITMREHQKFFSLRNLKSDSIEGFVTVANLETVDKGKKILAGNSRVLSARLSDAKFFLENDLSVIRSFGLSPFVEKLSRITFHNKIGNQLERVRSIKKLSGYLASRLKANVEDCELAAHYCKADLPSEVVREFPALQGKMGHYYAIENGNSKDVAVACAEHYLPLGPSDPVPQNLIATVVALADKIHTLTSFWSINEKPTGSKDPYALRRMAIGIVRILLENRVNLSLKEVFSNTQENFDIDDLISFLQERFRVHLLEKGFRLDYIISCLSSENSDNLLTTYCKIKALTHFLATPNCEDLVRLYKRANNLLRAEEEKDGVRYTLEPEERFFKLKEEKELYNIFQIISERVGSEIQLGSFDEIFNLFLDFRDPIANFFESVQINVGDQIIRRNRLCLINAICALMGKFVSFSDVETAS